VHSVKHATGFLTWLADRGPALHGCRQADVDLWHAALSGLTHELAGQGADLVQAFASTPWMAEGLRRSGFVSRFDLEFNLRDRQNLIPHGVPFHFTPLEADYAYT